MQHNLTFIIFALDPILVVFTASTIIRNSFVSTIPYNSNFFINGSIIMRI